MIYELKNMSVVNKIHFWALFVKLNLLTNMHALVETHTSTLYSSCTFQPVISYLWTIIQQVCPPHYALNLNYLISITHLHLSLFSQKAKIQNYHI